MEPTVPWCAEDLDNPGVAWRKREKRTLDRLALDDGRPEAAIDTLDHIAKRRSDSVRARQMLVDACLRLDTIESRRYAETLLRELVALEPTEPQHRYELATLLLTRGYQNYALQSLNDLLALAPSHPGAYMAMGDYTKAEPLYVEACDLTKEALGEEHPDYAARLNNLATLYKAMGDYTRAESLALQAADVTRKAMGESTSPSPPNMSARDPRQNGSR